MGVAFLLCFELFVRFLMVCDVVCIIDVYNLDNLSSRGSLCVLVGREIGVWIIGIVGVLCMYVCVCVCMCVSVYFGTSSVNATRIKPI